MPTRLLSKARIGIVVAAGLILGAGAALTASPLSASDAARKGCMQHNGSGNCDSCSPTCAINQVCCPIETDE